MGKSSRYAFTGDPSTTISLARCSNISAHFKNAVRGLTVDRAVTLLNNINENKKCVQLQFKKYNCAVWRCAQVKQFNTTQERWPVKFCKVLLELLSVQMTSAPRTRSIINPNLSNCLAEITLVNVDKF